MTEEVELLGIPGEKHPRRPRDDRGLLLVSGRVGAFPPSRIRLSPKHDAHERVHFAFGPAGGRRPPGDLYRPPEALGTFREPDGNL